MEVLDRNQRRKRMNVVLTKEGKRELEARVGRLDREVLPALREQLWAPDRDGQIDSALELALDERRRLGLALATSRVAEELADDPEVVEVGDWVQVQAEDGGRETFRIVDPIEAPLDAARISYESPLAQVLLGRRQGDEVELRTRYTPAFRYRIIETWRDGSPTAA
jgi:transcription elongation GreA/GreB family factor